MQVLLVFVILLCYAYTVWVLLPLFGLRGAASPLVLGDVVRHLLRANFGFGLGNVFLAVLLGEIVPPEVVVVLAIVFLLALVLLLAAELVSWFALLLYRTTSSSARRQAIRRLVGARLRGLPGGIQGAVRGFTHGVGEDLHFSAKVIDSLSSVRTVFRIHGLFLLLLPVLCAVLLASSARTDDPNARRFVEVTLGYNGLLIASFLTAALVVTFLLVSLLQILGIARFRLDWSGMLKFIAACVGLGTALGVFTAALVPVVELYLGISNGSGSVVSRISPQVMFEIPAIGAICGYVTGSVLVVLRAAPEARSRLVRRCGLPVVFLVAVSGLLRTGVSPRTMFTRLANTVQAETADNLPECSAVEAAFAQTDRLDTGAAILIVDRCMPELVVPNAALFSGVVVLLFLGALAEAVYRRWSRRYPSLARLGPGNTATI